MTETQEYQAAIKAAQDYEAMAAQWQAAAMDINATLEAKEQELHNERAARRRWQAEAGRQTEAVAGLRQALAQSRVERDAARRLQRAADEALESTALDLASLDGECDAWQAEAGRLADACAALRLALDKCQREREELRATIAALRGEN